MKYTPDHRGIARFLVSDDMHDTMQQIGDEAAAYAASIAPRDTGEYAGSFVVQTENQDGRATALVGNTDPGAATIEWGARGSSGHLTLTRTLDYMERG